MERRSREKDFEAVFDRIPQGLGPRGTSLFVDVPQAVRFVENNQIPMNPLHVICPSGGEFIGCQNDFLGSIKRAGLAGFLGLGPGPSLHNSVGEGEFLP